MSAGGAIASGLAAGSDVTVNTMLNPLPLAVRQSNNDIMSCENDLCARKKLFENFVERNVSLADQELLKHGKVGKRTALQFQNYQFASSKMKRRKTKAAAKTYGSDQEKQQRVGPKKQANRLKYKERKQLFDLGKGQTSHGMKFEDVLPLHDTWMGYAEELFDLDHIPKLELQLCKCDYHGALLTVTRSKNLSLIGQCGIVVHESKNTFRLLGDDNKLRTIPKPGCAFSVTFKGFLLTVIGNRIAYVAPDRINRKYKTKSSFAL